MISVYLDTSEIGGEGEEKKKRWFSLNTGMPHKAITIP